MTGSAEEQSKSSSAETSLSAAPSPFVQLVDGEGKFSETLERFITETKLKGKGINYNILSVFGPQSSGKSTLLNRLFGTHFPTMNARSGRYQVTLGVCMAHASKTGDKDILLMDLEGTDSKERGSGDDNMAFERKISLFALAISEVLLVNMWMQDIGRYNAANLSLLRIVFELNLQLFQKDKTSKTLLLFVIRDHIRSTTDIGTLKTQMMSDIEKIWSTIMKPKEFEESKVTDFFDFEFTSLPHKELQSELFETEIEDMRARFVDDEDDMNYVFKKQYKKSVPIDDFEMYARGIWQVIVDNKDLDIPTQKEMLAMYRCDEISSALYRNFEEHVIAWSDQLKHKQLISKLGPNAKEYVESEIHNFLEQTKLYVPDVVHRKSEEFRDRMISEVMILFNQQLSLLRQKSVDTFRKHLLASVQSRIDEGEVVEDFTNTTKQIHETVVNGFFMEFVQKSTYPGMEDQFNYRQTLDSLEEELTVIIEEYRQKQVEVLVKVQLEEMKKQIRNGINHWVTKPNERMWAHLRKYLNEIVKEEEEHLGVALRSLDVSDSSKYSPRIISAAKNEIISKVKEMTNVISLTLISRFEDLFKRDDNNMPRAWRTLEQIKEDYTRARQNAIKILDILFLCRLDHEELDHVHLRLPSLDESGGMAGIGEFGFPSAEDVQKALKLISEDKIILESPEVRSPSLSPRGHTEEKSTKKSASSIFEDNLIMTESVCSRAYEQYIMRTESIYSDAQRAQLIAQQNAGNLPWWVYVVFIVLGWDELSSILRNPIYLVLLLAVIFFFCQNWIRNKVQELIDDPNTHPGIVMALQFIQTNVQRYLSPNQPTPININAYQRQNYDEDDSPTSTSTDGDVQPKQRRQTPKTFKMADTFDMKKLQKDLKQE